MTHCRRLTNACRPSAINAVELRSVVRDKNGPWVRTLLEEGLELAQGLCNYISRRRPLLDSLPDFPIETLHLIGKNHTRLVRRISDDNLERITLLPAGHRTTEHQPA